MKNETNIRNYMETYKDMIIEDKACKGAQMSGLPPQNQVANWYGGFLKWEHPWIIHFSRIVHCKATILGYPHLWKPPKIGSHVMGLNTGR